MSRMTGREFRQGNQEAQHDQEAELFNFANMERRTDIALIMTVQTNGAVTIYNHPRTSPDKLKLRDRRPYPTGAIWDACSVEMAIYEDANDRTIVRLGAWNPGPPKKCYT